MNASSQNTAWILLILALPMTVAETVSSDLINAPFQTVLDHNAAMAGSLMGMNPHPAGVPYANPDPNNPLVEFSATSYTVMPSVDDRISMRHVPQLLWGWKQDQTPFFSWGDTDGCGHQKVNMTYSHSETSFIAYCRIGNTIRTSPNAGNPAALACTSVDMQTNPCQPLQAWVSGSTTLVYNENSDTVICTGICGPGGCSTYESIQHIQSEKRYSYSSSSNTLQYEFEPIESTQLLAVPFVNVQSSKNAHVTWLAFTNSTPAKYYALLDGKTFGAVYLARFSINQDESGIWSIGKTQATQIGLGGQDLQDSGVKPIGLNATTEYQTNVTIQTGTNPGISNESFQIQFRFDHQIQDDKILGLHAYSFRLVDEFDDPVLDQTYAITTTEPTTLRLTTDAQATAQDGVIRAYASLRDENDQALAERQIEFQTPDMTTYETTDQNGMATADVVFQTPGLQTLTVRFDNDTQMAGKTATQTIMVRKTDAERSAISAIQNDPSLLLAMLLVGGLMWKVKP